MNIELNTLCHHYFNLLYQRIEPYFIAASYKKKDLAATQGEILYHSLDKLIAAISLSEHDIFFDLGSGVGKITVQFFLKTRVKEAYGIEFIPELYFQSEQVAKQIERDLPEFYQEDRKLAFIQGNFLETSFSQATIIFLCSVCFSQETLVAVGRLINQHSKIHTVLSLRPIPSLQRLRLIKTIPTECTWDSALCYLYQAEVE